MHLYFACKTIAKSKNLNNQGRRLKQSRTMRQLKSALIMKENKVKKNNDKAAYVGRISKLYGISNPNHKNTYTSCFLDKINNFNQAITKVENFFKQSTRLFQLPRPINNCKENLLLLLLLKIVYLIRLIKLH